MRGRALIDSKKQRILQDFQESNKSPVEVLVDLRYDLNQMKKKLEGVDTADFDAVTARQHDMGTALAEVLTRLERLEERVRQSGDNS